MDGGDSLRLNSSQPPGMMADSNSYEATAPNDFMVVPNSAGMLHGMRLSFNTMTSSVMKPMDSPVSLYHGDGMSGTRPSGVLSMGDPMKKKRGRPRKYGPDGSMALALIPRPSVSGYYSSPMSDPGTKRRGRPPGSGKKQQLDALGSSGIAFTPHVITVKAGELKRPELLKWLKSKVICSNRNQSF